MTLAKQRYPNRYRLVGSGQRLPFTFWVDDDTWLKVTRFSSGTKSVLTLNTDYTVVKDGARGGTVVLGGSVGAAGDIIVISYDIPITQTKSFPYKTAFEPDDLRYGCDKLVAIMRMFNEMLVRTLKYIPEDNYTGVGLKKNRKGILRFDDDGDLAPTPPPVLLVDELKEFEATSGAIAVSYGTRSQLAPLTPCSAQLKVVVTLMWDTDDGDPSDDQKTLYVTLIDSASSTKGAGYWIEPGDWVSIKEGTMIATKNLPIQYYPEDLSGITFLEATEWEEVGDDGGLLTFSITDPDPAVHPEATKFVLYAQDANPVAEFVLQIVDKWSGTQIFPVGGGYYNPAGAGTSVVVDLADAGLSRAFMVVQQGATPTNYRGPIIWPPPPCEQAPINFGVFLSGPSLSNYAGAVSGHDLVEIGTTGFYGWELENLEVVGSGEFSSGY